MDENSKRILFNTVDYFERSGKMMQERGEVIATTVVRFGMAVALRHPEYAQAYHRMTFGYLPEADKIEDAVIDEFIRYIPLSVNLGADKESTS